MLRNAGAVLVSSALGFLFQHHGELREKYARVLCTVIPGLKQTLLCVLKLPLLPLLMSKSGKSRLPGPGFDSSDDTTPAPTVAEGPRGIERKMFSLSLSRSES